MRIACSCDGTRADCGYAADLVDGRREDGSRRRPEVLSRNEVLGLFMSCECGI